MKGAVIGDGGVPSLVAKLPKIAFARASRSDFPLHIFLEAMAYMEPPSNVDRY